MRRTAAFDNNTLKATGSGNINASGSDLGSVAEQLIRQAKTDQYDKARQRVFQIDEEDQEKEAYKRNNSAYKKDTKDSDKGAYNRMSKEEEYKVAFNKPKTQHPLLRKMSKATLKEGIIFSEVIGKPKGY